MNIRIILKNEGSSSVNSNLVAEDGYSCGTNAVTFFNISNNYLHKFFLFGFI